MAKNLLIVESPAKAKTIEKILGADFQVKSCFGHIRDLAKEGMGIDIHRGYEPNYLISEDKQRVVAELRSLAKKSEEVWLATDEDREGEAISWHLCKVLNLDPHSTKRIVFHEITKPAIQKAVAQPRTVNMDLVNAQQARRVLDRLVGFEMSPVLWRKVQGKLSAGRVQSVAVRILVEREREINQFESVSSFKIEGFFTAPDLMNRPVVFKAEGPDKFPEAKDARSFLERCMGASYQVADVQVKPAKRTPSAPFTTSTLQQEASRKLGYSVTRTMRVAQTLYENGHITYMRTDSVALSDTALEGAEKAIVAQYGEPYHQRRRYKNKNESAQEAHEAIRPTEMMVQRIPDADGQRLYELIWKRTMASQMADAQLERTVAKIDISTIPETSLTATGEVIKFDGFIRVYSEGRDDEDGDDVKEGMLPPLKTGQVLDFKELRATERFTRPQPRYTEASLVKKLEELGIGRPSTYASTISTIQQRGYVERRDKEGTERAYQQLILRNNAINTAKLTENTGAEKGKLFPTDLGIVVTDFLAAHFERVMDYKFTAKIEEEFDEIAQGRMEWQTMIDDFYQPFHHTVEQVMETGGRAAGERTLGKDPDSGKPVIARLGRFGPMVQIGSSEDADEKPRYARLREGQRIETITYEEALDLFKLPLTLGEYEGLEIAVNVGRFGPYVKWGEKFISLPKGSDPTSVDFDTAVAAIVEKEKADAPVAMYQEQPVTKGTGRFGPFLKWGSLYVNVPRQYDFNNLSEADIHALIGQKVEKEAGRYIQQWESEKITLENGRWGPFIRFGKKMLTLDRRADGTRMTTEEAAVLSLEDVKRMVEAQVPGAFEKKTRNAKTADDAPAKKATATKSKAPAKKAASKSSGTAKSTARKK
ncbi:MAG: type I DNA topoisomerase [Sphingobacteriales bacterium]|nr:MAG: type I DNA topoisomerase [Sphingobacteriales bacterium]